MAKNPTSTKPPKKGNWQKSIRANQKRLSKSSNKPIKQNKGGRGK